MHRETRRSGSAGGWRENSRRARVLKSQRRKGWAGGEVPVFQGGHHLRALASTWITTGARAERGREPCARHVTRLVPTQLHTPVPPGRPPEKRCEGGQAAPAQKSGCVNKEQGTHSAGLAPQPHCPGAGRASCARGTNSMSTTLPTCEMTVLNKEAC